MSSGSCPLCSVPVSGCSGPVHGVTARVGVRGEHVVARTDQLVAGTRPEHTTGDHCATRDHDTHPALEPVWVRQRVSPVKSVATSGAHCRTWFLRRDSTNLMSSPGMEDTHPRRSWSSSRRKWSPSCSTIPTADHSDTRSMPRLKEYILTILRWAQWAAWNCLSLFICHHTRDSTVSAAPGLDDNC